MPSGNCSACRVESNGIIIYTALVSVDTWVFQANFSLRLGAWVSVAQNALPQQHIGAIEPMSYQNG
eukprot:9018683-Pyramimonas_sp.AAC.1